MTVDISSMTPDEVEAHIARELELRSEIEALQQRLADGDYRTKTEKVYINQQYQEKFRELNAHLGYADE